MMAGRARADDPAAPAAYRDAVNWAVGRLAQAGILLMLELINPRDMLGYSLQSFTMAEALITERALPNLKLQFDIYRRRILHGDVTMALRRLMPHIGHIQVASVPSRPPVILP